MSAPSRRTPVYHHLGLAIQRTFQDWLILFPLVLILGGGGQVLATAIAGEVMANLPPDAVRADMRPFVHALVDWLFWLPVGIVAYPFLDAITIWCWQQRQKGLPTSAYSAVNWALARYGRMFGPHAKAYLAVYVGGQIVVGIFFGLQYAFVDAITATDPKAQSPLLRSSKLTQGRRTRIAAAWLPYVAFNLGGGLVLLPAAESAGMAATFGFGALNLLLLTIMEMVMLALYEERIEDARRAQEAAAASAAASALERPAAPV